MGSRMSRRTRRQRSVPDWWISMAGTAVLTAIVVATLTVATSHPEQHRNRLAAAVVNNDAPVTVKGQYTPLGRELAAKILDAQDTFDWSLMTTETAKTKLADGELAAVVTIPKDFSAKATSMATETPTNARRAIVHVQTAKTTGVSDAAVTEVVTRSALDAFNNELRENYLDNVYVGLSDMRTQFGKITSGAHDLADGAAQLDDGTSAAASGGDELVVGLRKLASGATDLSDGIDQLAGGASDLHSGTTLLAAHASQLSSATGGVASGAHDLSAGLQTEESGIDGLAAGASQLANGLASLDQQTAEMPAQAQQLQAGAAGVSAGASQLASGAHDLALGTAGVSDGASQLASGLAEFSAQMAALASASPSDTALQQAAGSAQALADNAAALAAGAQQSADGAEAARQGAAGLSAGADQLADGVSQLASGTPALATGVAQLSSGGAGLSAGLGQLAGGASDISAGAARLASGSSQLATGVAQFSAGVVTLDSGAGTLASGARDAATGSATFADGVAQAKDGGVSLASGLGKLADGTSQLSSGTSTFASKIASGAADLPNYTKADRNALKRVVSSPAGVTISAPAQAIYEVFFALLAIWIVTLAAFSFRPPLPHRLVESTRATWQLALDGALPAIAAGTLTAVLSGIIVWFGLGLDPGRALALCLLLVLAAVAFAFVNQALLTLLHGWGSLLSLMLAASLAARAFFSEAGSAFVGIFSATPLGQAWNVVLRFAAEGTADPIAVLAVIGWGLAAAAVMLAVVSSRRMTSGIPMRRARRASHLQSRITPAETN